MTRRINATVFTGASLLEPLADATWAKWTLCAATIKTRGSDTVMGSDGFAPTTPLRLVVHARRQITSEQATTVGG